VVINILYSSSDGNACHVHTENTSILIDCGVTRNKLFSSGQFPVDAIFITHEHGDHISGIHTTARATSAEIFIEEIVYKHMRERNSNYLVGNKIHFIKSGEVIQLGDFCIEAYATNHDSKGGLWYVVQNKQTGLRYGHLTDTGLLTKAMCEVLQSCDGMLLESNHDVNTLNNHNQYPLFLKNRIKGDKGHLSNKQTFDFIEKHLDLKQMDWIVFGHLSKNTNSPSLVLKEAQKRFPSFESFHLVPIILDL